LLICKLRFTILIKQEGMPMANDTDVLLKLCEEHWTEMRHIEDQRATITNIVIIITSAVWVYRSTNAKLGVTLFANAFDNTWNLWSRHNCETL
jgi:hypothetical protein